VTAEQTRVQPPLPHPSPISAPYWEAARRHELRIQRCVICRQHVFYPRLNCPACGSQQLDWVIASGRGTIYTYTIARRPTHPSFAGRTPLVIAIVELDEGPRMTTNIVGCDPDSVQIGMPVEAVFDDVSPETTLVFFRPASQGGP